MLTRIKRTAALGGLIALLIAVPQTTVFAGGQSSLADVRAATAKYHDVNVAIHDQYAPFLSCFDSPAGGMGQHYVNFGLLNGTIVATRPQAMVYEVDGTRLKLGAVEYITPIQDPSNPFEPAPTLFGQSFTRLDSLGVWVLHAWLWQPNPNGIFQNYNPAVAMCPH